MNNKITDKESFLKEYDKKIDRVIGEFKNEYGEHFVMYIENSNAYMAFITGDEFDWEFGMTFNAEVNIACRDAFFFSKNELKEIKKIIKKHKK